MRLKPIEPGMAIECKNDEEKKALLEELGKQGYIWLGGKSILETDFYVGNTIRIYAASDICNHKHIIWSDSKGNIEFADLIIQDLSAEEVLKIYNEICRDCNCSSCPMKENCFTVDDSNFDFKKVVEICEQWKANHEKKELETEWVWFAEVHGTNFDSTKNCKTEEEAEEFVEQEVKKVDDAYGKYGHVCRVKRYREQVEKCYLMKE